MKKVLIISYYWPPSGGPGVQRILKFAKYLPIFDWQPIILTVDNGDYPAIDEILVNEIPENCKIYKTKVLEPHKFYKKFINKNKNIPTYILNKKENESFKQKLSKWIRANFFLPDARIGWFPFIIREGQKIINVEKPDLIFSSSPPHSLQLGAKYLSKKNKIPWIADLRDPWTDAFWQKDLKRNFISDKIDKYLEHKVLSNADGITTVSEQLVNLFQKKAKNNYFCLPNGYDDEDYTNIYKNKHEKFRITYIGNLGKDQIIDNFLISIEKLPEIIKNNIEINFYGNFHANILDSIEKYKIKHLFNIYGYINHREALEKMVNSEILLLVIPNVSNNEGIVTGKIFEYLYSRNFIIGIGPKDGDAAKILEETGMGKMYNYNENMENIIIEKYNDWRNNDNNIFYSMINIEKYSRKNLTKELTNIFEKIIKK